MAKLVWKHAVMLSFEIGFIEDGLGPLGTSSDSILCKKKSSWLNGSLQSLGYYSVLGK